ncbi:hypothetical protein GGD61_007939 [Bradyrhizobium sp. SBR1B]|nr:hypothetical protein [Bradyrhizobium sp. SBR1B]
MQSTFPARVRLARLAVMLPQRPHCIFTPMTLALWMAWKRQS